MNIQHEEQESKGSFFIENEQGEKVAELTYSKNGDYRIILDHTEVNDDHRGEGLGKKLVYHAADYARAKSIKILPLCPYARVVVRRNKEEFKDVT
jgi:hypothetical protein